MLRLSMMLASVVLLATSARADTFGGWKYTAPPGYAVDINADHVALTKVTGPTFCSIAVFEARALDGKVLAERAFEWQNVVAHPRSPTPRATSTPPCTTS